MARILVIDDEANIRMMIRMALQKDAYLVEQAADGPEGLAKFGNGGAWDLVLVDQRMPGMEGLEVLREMRYRDPKARIVMITAYGTIDLAIEAMRAGATDFLRKPFTLETLRRAVKAAMGDADETVRQSGTTVIGFTTLNGFRIESHRQPSERQNNELVFQFTVRSPNGDTTPCSVGIPAYVVELVKAHAGCEQLPGGDSFWQGFSEEALANYIWQNAQPPTDRLHVQEFTTGLRRWTDSVLAARA